MRGWGSPISTISPSQFSIMLIIPVKEGENIERAQALQEEVRSHQTGACSCPEEYVKPKTVRREAMKKAVYKNKKALLG